MKKQESAHHHAEYLTDQLFADAVRRRAEHVWTQGGTGGDDPFGESHVEVYSDPTQKRAYVIDSGMTRPSEPDRVTIFRRDQIEWVGRWMEECCVEDPYAHSKSEEAVPDAQSRVVAALRTNARRRSELETDILKTWYPDA
jgi:hypothetical protein